MTGRRFQDIWKDQCEAARGVREKHGVISALEYLIGEKLMTCAETAVGRPVFARELPRFVVEMRSIFSAEEIRLYLQHLGRMAAREEEALSAVPTRGNSILRCASNRATTAGRGLSVWARYAHVYSTGTARDTQPEFRFIVDYTVPLWPR